MVPAGLYGRLRHLQRRDGVPAPAAPALRIQRVGHRVRQQFTPAFAQRHAVRLLAFKHCIGKIVFVIGGDKTVAAAPFGAELALPLPDVSIRDTFKGLRTGILMVIGHAGDVEPDAFHRRAFLRSRRVPPPECHAIVFLMTFPFRPFSPATTLHFRLLTPSPL